MKSIKNSVQLAIIAFLFFSPLVWKGEGGGVFAQNNNVGIGTVTPAPSALLDIDAAPSNNKGVLVPRMTAVQRLAIPSPANSLLVFDTDSACFFYWKALSTSWKSLCNTGSATPSPICSTASANYVTKFTSPVAACNSIIYDNGTNVGIGTGTAPAPSAALDVKSTTMGLLLPRLTMAERNAIPSPAQSLMIYNTTDSCYEGYIGNSWISLWCKNSCTLPAQPGIIAGTGAVCSGANGVAFSVTNVSGITYVWTYSGTGFTCASGCASSSITANFSAAATSGTLTVTPSNACGNGTVQTLSISINAGPSAANAGPDIILACGISTTALAGNTPAAGTGVWSLVSGTASITTPASPTSGITGLAASGSAVLRWTISNPPCSASTDDVIITTSSCFTCGSPLTDTRDGKTYGTVQIATQCWMAKNLDYGTYVPIATGQAGAGTQKYCYGDNTANCTTYGALYEWLEIMDGSLGCNGTGSGQPGCTVPVTGICPAGWHIPSHYEWTLLEKNVGSNPGAFPYDAVTTGYLGTDEGSNIKATGANTSGFSGLLGGYSMYGSFSDLTYAGNFWTTTESTTSAWYRYLFFSDARVERYPGNKLNGFSLRCVKD